LAQGACKPCHAAHAEEVEHVAAGGIVARNAIDFIGFERLVPFLGWRCMKSPTRRL
jgi:hypothetical protein